MGDIVRYTRQGKFIGWYVRYRDVDGRRKQRASHQPSKELARRYLLEVEGRIARGQVGIPERVPAAAVLTVADLSERFLAEYRRPKIKDLASYRLHVRKYFRMVLPLIGKSAAAALAPTDVAKLRDTLGGTYAPGTTRVCLAYLSAAYAWAVKLGLVPSNPVKGVERPTAEASIDYYSRDQIIDLLRCAAARAPESADDQLIACLVHLAVFTGLRRGELLGLRWQDLDCDSQRLTIARSQTALPKGGRVRHLRLPSVCVPWLRDWRRVCPKTPEGQVFPLSSAALQGKLVALLRAAGVRIPIHPCHALRHSFASHFIMAGGNILTLQKILGHSDVKVTLIYAHLAPDFLGAEMERLKF